MLVTLLGIVTDVRPEQELKASLPMLVTLLGMVVDWNPAIRVLEAFSIMALQFSRESYIVLPLSTTMEVREEQPLNAKLPMLVTLLGIVMDVRPEHLKASLPMLVTLLGIVMDFRLEQP